MRTYRLKVRKAGMKTADGRRPYVTYDLTVPDEIANMLIEGHVTDFTVELTEEGVLYRPAGTAPQVRPSWLGADR